MLGERNTGDLYMRYQFIVHWTRTLKCNTRDFMAGKGFNREKEAMLVLLKLIDRGSLHLQKFFSEDGNQL